MLYLKHLDAVSPHELASVGYRVLDLASLQREQVTIAPSVVVQSNAYDELIRANNLKYKIDYILSHAQVLIQSSLVNTYNGIRKVLLESKLPQGLDTELRQQYETLTSPLSVGELVATNERVPLRIIVSMNILEDPQSNDTIVQNITSFDELLLAVKEAWALAYHPSVLGARLAEKFAENKLKIALLVQVMDASVRSCQVFSCLPQDHKTTYVQAYAGYLDIRDKIGKDYYAIAKDTGRIIAQEIKPQIEKLTRSDAGELMVATLVEPITEEKISERDLLEIARVARKCERVLQMPQKLFFSCSDDVQELLWVNRLGFNIILEQESVPSSTSVHENSSSPKALDTLGVVLAAVQTEHHASDHPTPEHHEVRHEVPRITHSDPHVAVTPIDDFITTQEQETVRETPLETANDDFIELSPEITPESTSDNVKDTPHMVTAPHIVETVKETSNDIGETTLHSLSAEELLADVETDDSVETTMEPFDIDNSSVTDTSTVEHSGSASDSTSGSASGSLSTSTNTSSNESPEIFDAVENARDESEGQDTTYDLPREEHELHGVSQTSASQTSSQTVSGEVVPVESRIAARLLRSSLQIVQQVVERKYRGTFGETAQLENIAQMIDRLNQANVFSRRIDGPLLLQAQEAAHSAGHLTENEYAKVIEEVGFIMTYA